MTPQSATIWSLAPPGDSADLLEQAGYPRWLASLLSRRGVETAEEAERFLAPDIEHLHDAKQMAGLEAAIDRLLKARESKQKVAVVGDYDVDGVSGTAMMAAVLRACGVETLTIIPHRIHDGYGLQPSHVEKAEAAGCSLLITVDCGTTAVDSVSKALDAGLDVIVTDHHLPGESLPEGTVLVNPHQEGCQYPYSELSGAGLAFKLALAFSDACERGIDPRLLLRIACLGTIADLVPLRDENRVIASLGLRELERTRSPGLKALIEVSGVKKPYRASDVGYRLGPRLNAPGRLGSADHALELLLSRDTERATALATDLDSWNRERQSWERQAATEAREHFLAMPEMPAILVVSNPEWHRGVVGIAAGRLAREFNRPTILLAEENGQAIGSGRSIEGLNLHGFLLSWKDELEKFGGHSQAIGMTVKLELLEDLRGRWIDAAEEQWAEHVAVRRHEYELEMEPSQLHRTTLDQLEQLEPFGKGNSRPLIRVPGPLRLTREPRRFGHDHLEAELAAPDRSRIRVVGWSWAPRIESLTGRVEVLGHLEYDSYRGQTVLRLVDSRPAMD